MDKDSESRLDRLLPLLEGDPANPALIADAAEAAVAERRPAEAVALLDRAAAHGPLAPAQTNLLGLAAMQLGDFDRAATAFGSLLDAGTTEPTLRSNLAWAKAMAKDQSGALALLDDEVAAARPEAAMLRVQLLHDRGDFEEAAALARTYVELHPDHRGLLAAVSVLALDVEDRALAERCAAGAGDHPDALATRGTLALGDDRATEAWDLFDGAVQRNEGVPRAWIGRGLAGLLSGKTDSAAADIDRGAAMFGDHLGSWIAAGWAHFVNRDFAAARARFETALAIDPSFAESHGSIAVLDLLDGNVDAARKGAETALRLDRLCMSGALAQTLIAAGEGDADRARRIFEAALSTPIGKERRTIAQAVARMAL